jgi:hypothetical protein
MGPEFKKTSWHEQAGWTTASKLKQLGQHVNFAFPAIQSLAEIEEWRFSNIAWQI